MTTLKSISTKLDLIDGKKSKLKKAFEELKLHADSHPTFSSLEWEEINSYFTSLQSNLYHKFSLLKDQQSKPDSQRNASAEPGLPPLDPIPSRSELKSFCEKMDGIGLRNYITHNPKERATIRLELADAYKYAPDPAVLVLDAVQGFWPDGSGFGELGGVRRACVVLLEQFGRLGLEIPEAIKERAERLAVEWKGKIGTELGSADRDSAGGGGGGGGGGGRRRRGPSAVSRERLDEGLEKKGLLYLLAAFRLETGIVLDKNELVEYAVAVSACREAPELCHSLDFGDEICDVVQKLIDSGKQLIAVRFILQFELTNKFPPVPLLKSYISDSRKIANKIRNNGKGSRQSVNEAAAKEISSMKSVLKIIEDHNLEADYPKDGLLKNIEKLEKGKPSSNKRGAPNAPNSECPPKQQQREGRSRTITRRNGPSGASGGRRNVPPMQRTYVQNAGLSADPYLNTSAVAYGLAGSSAAPYGGASVALYVSGPPAGYSANLDPSQANAYPPESQTQPTYYDRPPAYGAYGAPAEYHLSYYPQ